MTKFVLEGGHSVEQPDPPGFIAELVSSTDNSIRILECIFSRLDSEQEKSFRGRDERYASQISKPFELRLATKENFLKNLEWANAVYFRGGNSRLLIDSMRSFPSWAQMLEGKVIAGSSAGANMLSRYYNGLDEPGIHEGIGILPLKVMVHYGSDYKPGLDWQAAEKAMLGTAPELPLVKLPEGKFVVRAN